jgi:hypothetical protein
VTSLVTNNYSRIKALEVQVTEMHGMDKEMIIGNGLHRGHTIHAHVYYSMTKVKVEHLFVTSPGAYIPNQSVRRILYRNFPQIIGPIRKGLFSTIASKS